VFEHPKSRNPLQAAAEPLAVAKSSVLRGFHWTEAARATLIEEYLNTGDLWIAADTLGIGVLEYWAERRRNKDFARRIDQARPLAESVLRERAKLLASRDSAALARLDPRDRKAAEEISKLLRQTLAAPDDEFDPDECSREDVLRMDLHLAGNSPAR
jgi:hypothetical protein